MCLLILRSCTFVGTKVVADEPELSIDDPNISVAEKLQKVRVQNLVREYLAAQELQLLGESGMSDAIQTFVEKDENRSISECVLLLASLFWGADKLADLSPSR